MLSKEILQKEYSSFKRRAEIALNKNQLEKSLSMVSYCALIAWQYPILFRFVDHELELLLEQASDKLIDKKERVAIEDEKKIVLYAGQLIDTGALTEQYLNFFIENGYKVLVVVPAVENTVLAKNTLKLIEESGNAEVYISKAKGLSAKIIDLYGKITEYNPHYTFLHFLPNDVIGYCVFSKITHIKRFYIVHNDHTFWLGKGCADSFLEFRKFGYLLSGQRRNIPFEKLHVLPFYPINSNIEFQGFPFDRTGKVVGVSGAHLYKYLVDPELKYFYAIKTLLKNNPAFVFCLCGYGDGIHKIRQIFQDDDIKDRFYFLGRRNDFHALIGEMDILIESYPLKGALTILYAIEQRKAFVGIGNPATGCIQEFFDIDYKEPLSIEEFIAEADLLIKDSAQREIKASMFNSLNFNKKSFDMGLRAILEQQNSPEIPVYDEELKIDDDAYLREYLMMPQARASLLRSKLFILKHALSFRERISVSIRLSRDLRHTITSKDAVRLLILLVSGR